MIYAVGPQAESDRVSPITPSLRVLRFALAAAVMFAVGLGSCVIAVWLVLEPVVLTGAVGDELRQSLPAHIEQTSPGQGDPAPPAVTPQSIEERMLVGQGADGMGIATQQQPGELQNVTAPINRSGQRLRCAHNAASVR